MKELCFVTGSGGFIGTHLRAALFKMGYKVVLVPQVILEDYKELENACKYHHPDYIFHLATYGNMYSHDNTDEIVTTNIMKTYFLLRALKDVDYKAFINFSTSSVLLDKMTFYSATKASGELLCSAFAQQGKPVVSVRPSSVYGPLDNKDHFIPTVINSLIKNKPMTLVPDPKHDWIFVSDLLEGVFKVVQNINLVKGTSVNISTGIQYSNEEIVKVIEKISKKELKAKIKTSMRTYDTKDWKVDNSAILNLGWEQKYTLEQGLKLVYDFMKHEKQKIKKKSS